MSSSMQLKEWTITFRRALPALAVSLGILLFCVPGFAQLNLGRIFGAVTDQSGGAVVGATVTVLDVARGVSRPLVSDGAGQYDATDLIPGTYTIRAEAKGFKIAEHTGVEVGVGKEARVDLTLEPGEQTQTITVTGDLPMINTSNAELGGTLEQLAVEELPVEGRNYQYLAWTRPGVIMHPGEGQFPFVSDGVRNFYSVWLIDGLINANMFVGGPSLIGGGQQNGDQATILPLDAIQEVNMIENPTAVYGDRPGAHINVGLKSGTNTLHGTAYAYGKDSGLAAKNPFITSNLPKAPLTLEQFGGSVGGPIKKDKVFYFANYEGQRYSVGVPRIAQEPTTADISGTAGAGPSNSIPDAIAGILSNGTVIPSALSLNLAGCSALVPAGSVTPNPGGGYLTPAQVTALKAMTPAQLAAGCNVNNGIFGNSGGSQNELTDLVTHGGSDNGIIKVDVHVNDKNSVNFDWFSGGGNIIAAGTVVQPYWEAQEHTWANMGRAVWIWTPNSTWLNEFRFGYDYGNLPVYVLECDKPGIGPNYAGLGFASGTPACQSQAGGGDVLGGFPLTTISNFTQLGPTNGNTQDNFQHYYSVLDNLSWTHGKHVVTAGIEDHFLTFEGDALTNGRGTLSFGTINAFSGATPLEDFLSGVTSSGNLLVGSALRTVEMPSYAAYIQDAWRALPRVTINAGLRYEYTGVLKDATGNGQLANFNPGLGTATGLFQETNSTNIFKPYPYNFEPRLGVAWDVFGNGKTVVHVGGGVMFESAPRLLNLLFVSSAVVSSIPTGFTFYNANGSNFKGPGNIATGTIAETGGIPAGNTAPTTGNSLPWTVGNPVFNASPSGLACGNGQSPALAAGGAAAGAPAVNPPTCVIQPYDLHDRAPYYITQTLSIQHAITNNLSVDIAYVGTRGENLDSDFNINAPLPGIKNTASVNCAVPSQVPTTTCVSPFGAFNEQERRPYNTEFPFYSNILLETHGEESNYNALQLTLTQRLSHGLNFSAGYTLQHNLDNSSTVMNPLNPILDYGNSTDNAPNSFVFTMTYYVPGRKSPGQLLQGWQINTAVNLLAGFSTNATDATDDLSGTGVGQDRWTMSPGGNTRAFQLGGPGTQIPCYGVAGSSFSKAANCTTVATLANMPALCVSTAAAEATNPNVPTAAGIFSTGSLALQNIGCYFVGSTAVVPPAQGTFGTLARDAFYGPHFRNWDFSATKNWKFKERYGVQFRAEFFNILNRTEYSSPATSLSTPSSFGMVSSTPDSGNPVIGNGPRKIQLGLKLSF